MASPGNEDVYATLLLNDAYLPGALVLAHSLRDAGTKKKLVVLYTSETVSTEVLNELKTVFDDTIPVKPIKNNKPANLYLMNRPDLHSAFTKINLWKLTQFRKIVYIDADVLALRAPDELFDLTHPFSAAPDIGWPDIFNTGVMALTPNIGDYHALFAMAERGVSFDGADQGLLNIYFKDNFNRLPFTYNVTPSAHYQYLPAYRHFQSSINMVHFIGREKPWFLGREATKGGSLHGDMAERWWSVYDKHYRDSNLSQKASELLRYFVKGEFNPADIPMQSWDPQRQPPPTYSKPEAENFRHGHYEMSRDAAPFVPPERYPPPPQNMWYNVPTEAPSHRPAPIFPWETHQPAPSRTFWDDDRNGGGKKLTEASRGEVSGLPGSQALAELSMTGSSVTVPEGEAETPIAPKPKPIQTSIWGSFDRTNAWDDVPEIQRYAQKLENHQRRKSRPQPSIIAAGELASEEPSNKRSLRVTDFPSDRPSLPVTPAPVRSKPKVWGALGDGELPVAQGVPSQADWDPVAQLQKLAKQQSEVVIHSLKGSKKGEHVTSQGEDTGAPKASLTVLSPQPVKGAAATRVVRGMLDKVDSKPVSAMGVPRPSSIPEPSYAGPGAAWERGEGVPAHVLSAIRREATNGKINTSQTKGRGLALFG